MCERHGQGKALRAARALRTMAALELDRGVPNILTMPARHGKKNLSQTATGLDVVRFLQETLDRSLDLQVPDFTASIRRLLLSMLQERPPSNCKMC